MPEFLNSDILKTLLSISLQHFRDVCHLHFVLMGQEHISRVTLVKGLCKKKKSYFYLER